MDDMIYCSNNCGVARCLHHPSQIDNPETPHQFAHLHHTDYCPLWRQEVEKVEVVSAQYERDITMASLFDGIGGFPYVFRKCGATPVWASEIEEFPIAVTKKRFGED